MPVVVDLASNSSVKLIAVDEGNTACAYMANLYIPIFTLDTGKVLRKYEVSNQIVGLHFSTAKKNSFYAIDDSFGLHVFDIRTDSKKKHRLNPEVENHNVVCTALSKNGILAVSSSEFGGGILDVRGSRHREHYPHIITFFDIRNPGEPITSYKKKHTSEICAMEFYRNGTDLITGSVTGAIKCYDTKLRDEDNATRWERYTRGPVTKIGVINTRLVYSISNKSEAHVFLDTKGKCGVLYGTAYRDPDREIVKTSKAFFKKPEFLMGLVKGVNDEIPLLGVHGAENETYLALTAITQYGVRREKPMVSYQGHTGEVKCMTVTRELLLTGGEDGRVVIQVANVKNIKFGEESIDHHPLTLNRGKLAEYQDSGENIPVDDDDYDDDEDEEDEEEEEGETSESETDQAGTSSSYKKSASNGLHTQSSLAGRAPEAAKVAAKAGASSSSSSSAGPSSSGSSSSADAASSDEHDEMKNGAKSVVKAAKKEAAEKEAKKAAEKEAKEKEAKKAAEKEAKKAAEKEAKEKEAKKAAEKEAKEKEAKKAAEKEAKKAAEKEAKEKEAKKAAEKEAKEKEAKKAAEKEAKKAAEKEAKEKEAKKAAEKEAKEKEAKKAKEKEARKAAEKEAKEKEKRKAEKAKEDKKSSSSSSKDSKKHSSSDKESKSHSSSSSKDSKRHSSSSSKDSKKHSSSSSSRDSKSLTEKEAKAKAERKAQRQAEREAEREADRQKDREREARKAMKRAETEAQRAERKMRERKERELNAQKEKESKEKEKEKERKDKDHRKDKDRKEKERDDRKRRHGEGSSSSAGQPPKKKNK